MPSALGLVFLHLGGGEPGVLKRQCLFFCALLHLCAPKSDSSQNPQTRPNTSPPCCHPPFGDKICTRPNTLLHSDGDSAHFAFSSCAEEAIAWRARFSKSGWSVALHQIICHRHAQFHLLIFPYVVSSQTSFNDQCIFIHHNQSIQIR